MHAGQNQQLTAVAQSGGVSPSAAAGPHPGPPPFPPTVSGGAPAPLMQSTASPFHPVVLEAAAVAANPAAAAALQQQPSPQMQNKGNLVNYAVVQSQYSPMQSQMGSGHYGSRGSQHNPQMPDQQQVQNVMNAHRSNPAAGNVMNSKDGRQGGQNQSSLHANENQQRGPKHGENRNYRSISEGGSGTHHMPGSISSGLGDRQNRYHSSMHVDHGTHHYTRAPQNYPSNQPRMFTSSQRKGGNNYYNQSQHPHQNPNQQLAHNPANLTAASATGGGVGFRHHSPKRVQGFNDPRQSYTQHTQPYQLTPSTFHASNQAGNQLAYQHLGPSVQPAPYMGRATATGHFHDPQQQHPSNVPPYPQHYPGASPLVHGYPPSGGYQGHHSGGAGGGGYSNSYNSPRSYNNRNMGGDMGRYDSGNVYYNNSSSNGTGGNSSSSSSPTDALNALAARYGIEAKFVVKEVEYLPQSNQNSNQYDANTGIANAQTRGSQMNSGYRQGGGPSGYQRSPPHLNSNYGSPYGIKFAAVAGQGGHQGNNSGQYFSGGATDGHTTPQNNRNRQIRSPRMYTVSLQIAGKEFIGQGRSQNQARNTAASSAVKELQKNPLKPDDVMKYKRSTGATSSTNEKTGSSSAATSSSQKESSQNASRTSTAHKVGKVGDASTTEGEKSSAEENSVKVKPAISQVYELAQRMNLPVVFEENFQEGGSGGNAFHSGGPKSFTVKCKVGEHETEGQAHGKKIAHRMAARKMLEILNTLDVPPPRPRAPQTLYSSNSTGSAWRTGGRVNRKTLQQVIKGGPSGESKSDEEFLNPISRLVQILQLQKGKSPVFTVRSQINGRRSREFHVEVSVGTKKAEGHGSNKKVAKKQAAVNMLQSMGYTVESKRLLRDGEVIPPPEPKSNQSGSNRRVTFKDPSLCTAAVHGADNTGVLSGNISASNLQPGMVHILSKGMVVASLGGVDAVGDASGVTEEAKQDMLDEQAGYVSATDFAVLERQRAMDAQAMFMKQRFWNQRQNAIKIAKEFHASDLGSSETATKLLSAMSRSVDCVVNATNATAEANEDKEKVDMTKPRHQMKVLCCAVSAILSFQDYTKVSQSNEHSTRLKMTLGKVFEIEASSSLSVDDARDKASQSALNLIANADPNSAPCYLPQSFAFQASTPINLTESTFMKDSPGNSTKETTSVAKGESNVSVGACGDTQQHSDSDNWAQGDNSTHVLAGNETSAEHCSETITESPVAADNETSASAGQPDTSSRNEIYEDSRTNSAIGRNKTNASQQNTQSSTVE